MASEYDRKMKLQEERILQRRANQDQREIYEMRRQNAIEIDVIKNEIVAKDEQIDYYKSSCEKLETENHQLKTGKGDGKRMRELENEIEMLKSQAKNDNIGSNVG